MIKPLLFLKELLFFGATQVLGIFVALRIFPILNIESGQPFRIRFSVYDFFILAVIIFLFILFFKKKTKFNQIFFKIFFIIILLSGAQLVFLSFFSETVALLAAILVIIGMVSLKIILMQDIAVVLAIAGIGAVLGLGLTPLIVVFILIILSFYDIIAVYKTKHMIKLAETMIKSRTIFGFIIPFNFKDFFVSSHRAHPGEGFMILGSGDIIMPVLLSASLVPISLRQSLFVLFFSLIGLFIAHLLFVNQEKRRPMAALPPIAAMSIIGYLISLL